MFYALATSVTRWRIAILVAAVVLLGVAGVFGGSVASQLSSGGFDDPGSESAQARRQLDIIFGTGDPNLVLLVTAKDGGADDPAVAAAATRLTAELAAEPDVAQAVSYWTLGTPPPLRSRDGASALVLARISGDDDAVAARAAELVDDYTRDTPLLTVGVGGSAAVFHQVGETIEADLVRAESLAFPLTLVLLIFVFGSVVAALLPLAVGVVAILGTFLILRLIAGVTDVSIYAINLTTALGLGLAIDYALFIVSRFREELRGGHVTPSALTRTLQTAGKTVAFSAATVAISLAALMVFPLMFLRSFAYAGIAVVAFAAFGSLVILPALLAVLGPRVDTWQLRRPRQATGTDGFWHRIAVTVMRRPLPIATVIVGLLLLLGAPFLGVQFGSPDDRVLPPGNEAREVAEQIREGFDSREAGALSVVATATDDPAARADQVDDYAAALSTISGVARVDAETGSYVSGDLAAPANASSERFTAPDATWLSVIPSVEPMSVDGEGVVAAVRDLPAPFPVQVAGASADLVDSKAAVFSRAPLAAVLIGAVTFVVLFLMFGSLLVPAKAVVLNLLSLTATFGAMVWVFQDGNLGGLLGFTATGTIDTTTPILMFCIAFGLSMDYEVFLLSRIKEEHDRGADTVTSVAMGLERTGGIVTAAAAIIAVVFVAFATSGITFIKLLGVGLALAVVMDATLIRATLVPAFMRLAGDANWWAPRPLRRVYERFGFSESVPDETPAARAGAPSDPVSVGGTP